METSKNKPWNDKLARENFRHTLNNQVWPQDGHPANTDTSFGGSIGSSETSEDDGGGATQCTEEGLYHPESVACWEIWRWEVRMLQGRAEVNAFE